MTSSISSLANCGSDFLANARIPRITSLARPLSRTMRENASRAWSRSGFFRFSQFKPAAPFDAMPASGWLISWAIEAVICPTVVTRLT